MHRLSDPQQPAGRPFCTAAVRAADANQAGRRGPADNAERNSPERKWPSELSELSEGRERPKDRGFCGSISDRVKLSEIVRILGPPPNGPQTNPGEIFVTRY
jgi:hypothetical protein